VAVTIEQIEDALSRTILGRVPKEVFILDGIIDVPTRRGVRYAIAMMRTDENFAVFTPLSRLDSIFHEALHGGLFGFGILNLEPLSEIGGRILAMKYQLFPGLPKRIVRYQECSCASHDEILRRLKLQPAFQGVPQIRHYILMEVV